MDLSALAAHLDFTAPAHRDGCTATGWEVDYRTSPGTHRDRDDDGHSCRNEDCRHGDQYRQLQVRIVCRACGAATLLQAEEPTVSGIRTTDQLGFGTAPRKVHSLWVYTGPPPKLGLLSESHGEPTWYLVARHRADRLTPEDVVGSVWPATGKRGGAGFTASTDLVPFGEPHWDRPPTYAFKQQAHTDGLHFPTVAAAVRWIEQQLTSAHPGGARDDEREDHSR